MGHMILYKCDSSIVDPTKPGHGGAMLVITVAYSLMVEGVRQPVHIMISAKCFEQHMTVIVGKLKGSKHKIYRGN